MGPGLRKSFARVAATAGIAMGMQVQAGPYLPLSAQDPVITYAVEFPAGVLFNMDRNTRTGTAFYFCPGKGIADVRQCFEQVVASEVHEYTGGGKDSPAAFHHQDVRIATNAEGERLLFRHDPQGNTLTCPGSSSVNRKALDVSAMALFRQRIVNGDIQMNTPRDKMGGPVTPCTP